MKIRNFGLKKKSTTEMCDSSAPGPYKLGGKKTVFYYGTSLAAFS